jgi:hypothetical protein
VDDSAWVEYVLKWGMGIVPSSYMMMIGINNSAWAKNENEDYILKNEKWCFCSIQINKA